MLQLREAAVAAMLRAQQEKAKPQAQPPSLEERASGKPAGKEKECCLGSHWLSPPMSELLQDWCHTSGRRSGEGGRDVYHLGSSAEQQGWRLEACGTSL